MPTTALSFALQVGIVGAWWGGDDCAPGYILKSNTTLANLSCSDITTSTASCATCCQVDLTKCDNPSMRHGTGMVPVGDGPLGPGLVTWHGIPLTYVKCPSHMYQDPSKAGTNRSDLGGGVNECCTAVANCSQVKCLGATSAKKSAVNMTCAAGVSSCLQSTCCEADNTKCGARNVDCGIRCASGAKCDPKGPPCDDGSQCEAMYHDEDKAAMQVNSANEVARCCSKIKTCAAHKCVNGTQAKLDKFMKVDKFTMDLPTSFLNNWAFVCCEKDVTKCGGQTPELRCDAGTLMQTERVGTTKDVCCQAVARCAAFAPRPKPLKAITGSGQKFQPSVTSFVLAMAGVIASLEVR